MRKIRDILRVRHDVGLSYRAIALSLHIGFGTVNEYLKRAEKAGLGWPLPPDLQERDLHTTCPEHMPEAHQRMAWSPERFLRWAADIGPQTRAVVEHVLREKRHREQSYRRILALLANAKKYGNERLDNACGMALLINSPTRTSVESILEKKLDLKPETVGELDLGTHENIRGEAYYN